MFASLLIANRGEIACRVIRTAKALGIRTVAVYSDADGSALHAALADAALPIAGPPGEAYLDGAAIIAAARSAGAEAIHPGYGFLAENAEFAEASAAAGLAFVGPPAAAIRAMGAKDEAKRAMRAAGVPVVPGSDGTPQDDAALAEEAARVGYPVLIKPVMGGGGKGMRRVERADALAPALAGAKREAAAAFGDERLIVEKLIARARHVEVQVFADAHGHVVHLFERDCSAQRRHQKVIEEAPAPGLTAGLRARMSEAAMAAARAVAYEGAGTVEFILDAASELGDDTPFHFLEMNTRLQVEHPVTEMVTGVDLVEWQIRVAAGEPLPASQDEIALHGHAVEARLYAEDPRSGFLPATGRVLVFEPAAGEGIRIDTGIRAGDMVTPHYDPLIAKVIGHGADREAALDRLRDALIATVFAGPETNQELLWRLLDDQALRAGAYDTGLIDRKLDALVEAMAVPEPRMLALGARAAIDREAERWAARLPASSPWAAVDGFGLGPPRQVALDFVADGAPVTLEMRWQPGAGAAQGDGGHLTAMVAEDDQAAGPSACRVVEDGPDVVVAGLGRQLRVRLADAFAAVAAHGGHDAALIAPMPGRITELAAGEGEVVDAGARLMVLEAMKMEHVVRAPRAGRIARINVVVGGQVERGQVLAVLDGEGD